MDLTGIFGFGFGFGEFGLPLIVAAELPANCNINRIDNWDFIFPCENIVR